MIESDAVKAEICKAFGVSVEDVDALDRAMRGPEERRARQAGKTAMLEEIRRATERINEGMPPGFTLVWIPTNG